MFRACYYELAVSHAEAALELAEHNQFVTLEKESRRRLDNLKQTANAALQRHSILNTEMAHTSSTGKHMHSSHVLSVQRWHRLHAQVNVCTVHMYSQYRDGTGFMHR